MAITYEPLATTTLGSATSSITFSSISSSYTDLRIIFTGTTTLAGETVYYRFNSDSATNYSVRRLWANSGGVGNDSLSNATQLSTTYAYSLDDTRPQLVIIDILSYAGSTFKTSMSNHAGNKNGTAGGVDLMVGLWRSTSAINSIFMFASGGTTFKTGTRATLYGILKA